MNEQQTKSFNESQFVASVAISLIMHLMGDEKIHEVSEFKTGPRDRFSVGLLATRIGPAIGIIDVENTRADCPCGNKHCQMVYVSSEILDEIDLEPELQKALDYLHRLIKREINLTLSGGSPPLNSSLKR